MAGHRDEIIGVGKENDGRVRKELGIYIHVTVNPYSIIDVKSILVEEKI